jgi:hypothetical protein
MTILQESVEVPRSIAEVLKSVSDFTASQEWDAT